MWSTTTWSFSVEAFFGSLALELNTSELNAASGQPGLPGRTREVVVRLTAWLRPGKGNYLGTWDVVDATHHDRSTYDRINQ